MKDLLLIVQFGKMLLQLSFFTAHQQSGKAFLLHVCACICSITEKLLNRN